MKLPVCPKCGHPQHMHTADTDGNGTPHCWHLKFTGDGQWPCPCDWKKPESK